VTATSCYPSVTPDANGHPYDEYKYCVDNKLGPLAQW
jgi:hypothetical protein